MAPKLVQRYIFDQLQQIAEGLDPKRSLVHKFGANGDVGGTAEDIWTPGGVYPWPEAAETVRIKAGGDATDTAAGDGARSVTIEGLDENWAEVSETVVTAGAGASDPTTATFIRVFRAFVATVGVYGAANTAAIQIENTTSTDVIGYIGAGLGQTEMSQYTIPAGKKGYLLGIEATVDSAQSADLRMWQRQDADDVTVPFTPKRLVTRFLALETAADRVVKASIEFLAKTDIWIDGTSGGASSLVAASYDLVLVTQ